MKCRHSHFCKGRTRFSLQRPKKCLWRKVEVHRLFYKASSTLTSPTFQAFLKIREHTKVGIRKQMWTTPISLSPFPHLHMPSSPNFLPHLITSASVGASQQPVWNCKLQAWPQPTFPTLTALPIPYLPIVSPPSLVWKASTFPHMFLQAPTWDNQSSPMVRRSSMAPFHFVSTISPQFRFQVQIHQLVEKTYTIDDYCLAGMFILILKIAKIENVLVHIQW